jgi:hypothetical protein
VFFFFEFSFQFGPHFLCGISDGGCVQSTRGSHELLVELERALGTDALEKSHEFCLAGNAQRAKQRARGHDKMLGERKKRRKDSPFQQQDGKEVGTVSQHDGLRRQGGDQRAEPRRALAHNTVARSVVLGRAHVHARVINQRSSQHVGRGTSNVLQPTRIGSKGIHGIALFRDRLAGRMKVDTGDPGMFGVAKGGAARLRMQINNLVVEKTNVVTLFATTKIVTQRSKHCLFRFKQQLSLW